MQETQLVPLQKLPHPKPRKKNPINKVPSAIQKKGTTNRGRESIPLPVRAKKGSKKKMLAEASTGEPTAYPLISSSDYQALRHKYMLLEEESMFLDRQLSEIGGEVQRLEDEKSLLLDHLIVLEGLIDPLELKHLKAPPTS